MTLERIADSFYSANDPSIRMDMVEKIADLNRTELEGVVPFLQGVLRNDADPIVRHEAAFVLGKLRARKLVNDDAVHDLCEAALSDASLVVRHEAAEALAAFRGNQVETTLRNLLNSEIADLRLTAQISLSRYCRR